MSYRLAIKIPGLPPMNTGATRRSRMVQAREAKKWKEFVVLMVGRKRPQAPLARAHLWITRHSSKMADRVNIAQSCKAVVDGLVAARILLDDSPKVLLTESYEWAEAPQKAGAIEIVVEEAA